MKYYDIRNDIYLEKPKNKSINFLYSNVLGRIILKIMISKPIRFIYNKYMISKLSTIKINNFIKNNNIDLSEYEEKTYTSFNDFFIRIIKKENRPISKGLFAIADSKLSVYKIDNNSSYKIKHSIYTTEELLGEKTSKFKNGYALVFRLDLDDYHHYVFPDDGEIIRSKRINGKLHTVQPLAFKRYKVFNENTREITYLNTKNYGEIAYIEVGAMMIGKIVNEKVKTFKRGDEKGHFEFGGSTVIMLIQKNKVKINEKLIENTKKNIETIVRLGDSLN